MDIIDAGRFFSKHGANNKGAQKLRDLAHHANSLINMALMELEGTISGTGGIKKCRDTIAEYLPSSKELDRFFPDPAERRLAGEAAQQFKIFHDELTAVLRASPPESPRRR